MGYSSHGQMMKNLKETTNEETLLTLFEEGMEKALGVDLPPRSAVKSRGQEIFKDFISRWGKEKARAIVIWATHEAGGRAPGGSILTVSSFTEPCNWIAETFWMEYQLSQKDKVDQTKRNSELRSGFMNLKDL